jgi:hypothetical protein
MIGPAAGSCERGNKPSATIKYWEIFEELNGWWLLENDSTPASVLPSVSILSLTTATFHREDGFIRKKFWGELISSFPFTII